VTPFNKNARVYCERRAREEKGGGRRGGERKEGRDEKVREDGREMLGDLVRKYIARISAKKAAAAISAN